MYRLRILSIIVLLVVGSLILPAFFTPLSTTPTEPPATPVAQEPSTAGVIAAQQREPLPIGQRAAGPLPRRQAVNGEFHESFDGNGPAPILFSSPSWDVAVHTRHADRKDEMAAMAAHHGDSCAPFPNTHHVASLTQAVFICRDHMMTSLRADDYGLIYLTPDHLVDFSQGEAVIRFDMSTLRTSSRDWVDVWITPFDDHLQLPFDTGDVDLQGVPRRAVHLQMADANGQGTMFRPTVYADHKATADFPPFSNTHLWGTGYESVLQPSATRRDTFELRISQNRLKFGLPDYNLWWVDREITRLDWNRGVVQLGHHSYTPEKDCTSADPVMCKANTWHWDNVRIAPAVPFTMIKAAPRWADAESAGVSLERPAINNSWLRFSGIGKQVQVRFDGGEWQSASQAAQEPRPQDSEGHFASYWMPIPAGVTRVEFAGQRWWGGDWRIKDVAVWSMDGVPEPALAEPAIVPERRLVTNPPQPAAVPALTPTAGVPRQERAPAPPTAATSSPACRVWVEIDGAGRWREIEDPQLKRTICGGAP